LWAADATDGTLVELDVHSGSIRRTLALGFRPSAVAPSARAIWVAGSDAGTVQAIDPRSGQPILTIQVGQGPNALAVQGNAVWVTNGLDATVSRIDASRGALAATIPVGDGPSAIAVTRGSIWVASTNTGTVSRIDPDRNRVVSTIRVGGRPAVMAASSRRLWVGSAAAGSAHRGGTLVLATTAWFPSIDPALQYTTPLLARLAHDTLVTFEATAGPAGLRLVPDLALAVPAPAAGGTTYAFRLRPGILYSDGERLRARDFRRAIERLFRLNSPGANSFSGLVGGEACTRNPARCRLAHGIVTDDAARTVVFHLRAPDPDFLYKLTVVAFSAPVPPSTPDRDTGSRAVPGTGPYRIAVANRRELRLVRNEFFHEWSHAAQPDGNPESIVWRFFGSASRAAREVERGRADWVFGLIPQGQLRDLELRSPSQLHENPSFGVDFIPLNTRRPPFDDLRVRRALNYALDRSAIARAYGPAAIATPTCQPLPPRFPGYRRYCPYTSQERRDGLWTSPDLRRARRLVASSGTLGARIDVWGATDLPFVPRRIPGVVAETLRSLGYRTRLHLVPYESFSPTLRSRLQLTVDGDWFPDYPAPSSYLPAFFGCHGGSNRKHYLCDPRLDRWMRSTTALQLRDPRRAAAQWAEIDHELVDRAYWVPTVNVGSTELTSARLRNYQFHPIWGFLAARAWLSDTDR